jgi:hypothetical protein
MFPDAGEPQPGAIPIHCQGAGHIQENVTNEEQGRGHVMGGDHLQLGKRDILPVNVADNESRNENRHEVPHRSLNDLLFALSRDIQVGISFSGTTIQTSGMVVHLTEAPARQPNLVMHGVRPVLRLPLMLTDPT